MRLSLTAAGAVALSILAAACGTPNRAAAPPAGPPPPPGPAAAAASPLADPGMRLPRDLAISSYDLRLRLDPAQPTMAGTITIHGKLERAVDVIWLHGEALKIEKAHATRRGPFNAGDFPLEVVTGTPPGKLALRASAPLPVGDLELEITYSAPLADTETAGTFRQQVGADWYAFTQHEAISARRSFPCLDEPDLKVPWRVQLTVPRALIAVANAPTASEIFLDDTWRVVQFAPTEAIPSYLVAYAVGPFDIVEAGKSAGGTPHRILTLRGRAAEAAYAAELMPRVTSELERWFDMPHPFAKLDSISIPATIGFGAMENPGLITYRETLLLLPPDASTLRKSRLMYLASHEIAHQWFGNLVTPVWWDDLWLNESFASWLPEKIVAVLEPGWRRPEDSLDAREEALTVDALATTRRVRQPIVSEGDIVTAFDRITYAKGATVLRLFEARVGPERFQAGVRAYIRNHARGNATAADFLAAIDGAAPDSGAGAAMATLIDQAGAPRLTASLECPKGGQAGVRLSQQRFVPPGAGAIDPQRWRLPVCVRAGGNGRGEQTCVAVTEAETFVPLASCATWVWPNTGGLGYWRTTLDRALWASLRTAGWKQLTAPERIAVAHDLFAAVGAGELDVAVALELVPALIAEDNRIAIAAAAGLIRKLEPWVPAAQRPRFAAWVRAQLGRPATRLGWLPRAKDDLQHEALRRDLVELVATVGEDAALRRAAVKLARTWRKLPDAARGDVLATATLVDPALVDGLIAEFRAETSRGLRADLARALGAVRQAAALERALALTLDPAIDLRDSLAILDRALGSEHTRPVALAFVLANFDALLARLPGDTGSTLIGSIIGGCDLAAVEAQRALVESKLGALRGARRRIDQAFERVSQCAARKSVVEPALATWLAKAR